MTESTHYLVHEVHNFGGFFGGDTVMLTATRRDTHAEQSLTIDEGAFTNVRDRYTIAAGMLLELTLSGERVDRAELLGAASQAELRAALGPVQVSGPLAGPADPELPMRQLRAVGCRGAGGREVSNLSGQTILADQRKRRKSVTF